MAIEIMEVLCNDCIKADVCPHVRVMEDNLHAVTGTTSSVYSFPGTPIYVIWECRVECNSYQQREK